MQCIAKIILNILNMLVFNNLQGNSNWDLSGHRSDTVPVNALNCVIMKVNIPEQFKDDIDALCSFLGVKELEAGMMIKATLSEVKDIMPRKRPCIDSYLSLVNYLKDSMGVDLLISSNKTKV